jgi:hypothetical protein
MQQVFYWKIDSCILHFCVLLQEYIEQCPYSCTESILYAYAKKSEIKDMAYIQFY